MNSQIQRLSRLVNAHGDRKDSVISRLRPDHAKMVRGADEADMDLHPDDISDIAGLKDYMNNQGIAFNPSGHDEDDEDVEMEHGGSMLERLRKRPERDYRTGGHVDDPDSGDLVDAVPAYLNKDEFVINKDAVRGIGDGDIDKGLENLTQFHDEMKRLGRKYS